MNTLNLIKQHKKCYSTVTNSKSLKYNNKLSLVYRKRNEDVQLSHLLISNQESKPQKDMIVLHGLLGSKINWRGLCKNSDISKKRNCYLVELRNHLESNHHDDMNYNVITDDLMRFADQQGLNKFSVLGHSLGGRTAMTLACRFPDRIDGCISVDAAPIDESNDKSFGEFTYGVLRFMNQLNGMQITKKEAVQRAKQFFNNKMQFVSLIDRNCFVNDIGEIEFGVNIKTLYEQFWNIPYFGESLRYYGPCFHLVGERSRHYKFEQYKKVFPNIKKEDIMVVKRAGHWVHFDNPADSIKAIVLSIDKIDDDEIF